MIRIGYTRKQKQSVINEYLNNNKDINHVYIFTRLLKPSEQEKPEEHKKTSECYLEFPEELKVEYINWPEVILYRTYWPLLSNIDKNSLIIVDEFMKVGIKKRSDLTYNCLHHYLAGTNHRIIFEYSPFIDNENDIMILFDMEDVRYKSKPQFNINYIYNIDFKCIPRQLDLETIYIDVNEKGKTDYINKVTNMFDNLGAKDPLTIANQAQLIAGNLKKDAISLDKNYLARNARFKKNNVYSLSKLDAIALNDKDWYFIDAPLNRIELTDAIKLTKQNTFYFLSTGLSIDKYIIEEHTRIETLKGRFYEAVKASL